jgi:tetratricopeptide (TPR) repeat protein
LSSEEIRWYVLPRDFRTTVGRSVADGVYEASVLTVAACHSVYSGTSEGIGFLQATVEHIVRYGGFIHRWSGGHLTGLFIGKSLADGATGSVDCACAIRMEAERKHSLRTFLGVNTGPVLLESPADAKVSEHQVEASGQVFAHSEVLTLSLLPGTVVLSPATFRLVAPIFDCYGTGAIGLWGDSPPASGTVYVVNGPKKPESWKHRLDDDSVPLLGRQKELNLLCRYWEKAGSRKSRRAPLIVHLVGEPGSGKSRLLQAFLAKITKEARNMTVLKVAGSHYGRRPGLLSRELAVQCAREEALKPEADGGARLAEGSALRKAASRPGSRAGRLSILMQGPADRGPLLVVIDDLHWADKESARITGRTLGLLSGRIMVIASYRPSGSQMARLLAGSCGERIALKPLDESTGRKISSLHSGEGRFPQTLWREIWEKSRGNPLYVEEATKLLLNLKKDPKHGCLPDREVLLPDAMAGLLIARIKEWAEKELDDLRAELKCRMGASSALLRLARIETRIDDWLDRLETENYIERSELAECLEALEQFQNEVVMLCIVGGLSRPLTTRLGEAVSRLYEGAYRDHYRYLRRRAAKPETRSSAGAHALRVARRALGQGRPREAAAFFNIADEALSTDHPLRRGMLENAGDASFTAGRLTEAIGFYERSLKDTCPSETERGGTSFKLGAARILDGEEIPLSNPEHQGIPFPWDLVLTGLAAILGGKMEAAAKYAFEVETSTSDWAPNGYILLLGAAAKLAMGDPDGAAALCKRTAEIVPTGGASLISFGLHWLLSETTQGQSRQRHMRTWKDIAKRLGISSVLGLYRSMADAVLIATTTQQTTFGALPEATTHIGRPSAPRRSRVPAVPHRA